MKSMFKNVQRKLSSATSSAGFGYKSNNEQETTPRADVTLPGRRERRRSHTGRADVLQEATLAMQDLPKLKDVAKSKEREEIFERKLKLCEVCFNFEDANGNKRGKDLKRTTLLELVDYVNTSAGQKIFTETMLPKVLSMVGANIFRALPPQVDDFDPEEDEPVLEPSWPHLQVVYEFLLRFIVSSEVNAKVAKNYVNKQFCTKLVALFDSEDPRERDYLKTILHRIYGKFMAHRSFVRKAIKFEFFRFVYETERHNGIGELLEILGSIINGFALPLKDEHVQFMNRALIPLHKPACVSLYHQQLSYCATQYVEKEPMTGKDIILGLVKYWPWKFASKQVLFLNELEEILELVNEDVLKQVKSPLFSTLARCIGSDHFQVAERALFLWNNDHLVTNGCLNKPFAPQVLPFIYKSLFDNSQVGHWNPIVGGLTNNVLKLYMDYDIGMYDQMQMRYDKEEEANKKKKPVWAELDKKVATSEVKFTKH